MPIKLGKIAKQTGKQYVQKTCVSTIRNIRATLIENIKHHVLYKFNMLHKGFQDWKKIQTLPITVIVSQLWEVLHTEQKNCL